jgi:hypothetical protein
MFGKRTKIAVAYCEGKRIKIATFAPEERPPRLIDAASFDVYLYARSLDQAESIDMEGFFDAVVERIEKDGLDLRGADFVAALADPSLHYRLLAGRGADDPYADRRAERFSTARSGALDEQTCVHVELADAGTLSVYPKLNDRCLWLVERLAEKYGYAKEPIAVKSAEISLANHAAASQKFFADDRSIVLYAGPERLRMTALVGRMIFRQRDPIEMEVASLMTYANFIAVVSDAVAEFGFDGVDNVVVGGDEGIDGATDALRKRYPKAEIAPLVFPKLDLSALRERPELTVSEFAPVFAVALEFFREEDAGASGFNLIPSYVKERRYWRGVANRLRAALVVPALALLAVAYLIVAGKVEEESIEKRLAALEKERAKRPGLVAEIERMDGKLDRLEETLAEIERLRKERPTLSPTLDRVAQIAARSDVRLDAAILEEGALRLARGYAPNKQAPAEFADRFPEAFIDEIVVDGGRVRFTTRKEETR